MRALVLGAAGASGAFQAGAIQYMADYGLVDDFGVIVGVSVGAINGAWVATGRSGTIADEWLALRREEVLRYPGPRHLARLLMGKEQGLFSGETLLRYLRSRFRGQKQRIPMFSAITSLSGGHVIAIPGVDPIGLAASVSVPGLFSPVALNAEEDADVLGSGGLRGINALKLALMFRPDEVVIINCSPRHLTRSGPIRWLSGAIQRTIDIVLSDALDSDIRQFLAINSVVAQADRFNRKHGTEFAPCAESGRPYAYYDYRLIEPEVNSIGVLDFHPETIRDQIEQGYLAAQKAFAPTLAASLHESLAEQF
jgi:predicted acylesterase/phospholipase RssA